ncbi:MAG: hypothetical protein QMD22_08310 [archaeon]|nr:hypothetical protein [archaeon]
MKGMREIPMINTTKSKVNPNYQIQKRKNKAKIEREIGSIGVWDLFGSIGMYWNLGFFRGKYNENKSA